MSWGMHTFCRKVGLPTPGEVAAEAAQDKAKA